jgi:sugar/nucleoside kinase (ribokinase family)
MPPEPPLIRLDLLLVGGVTVDRFADGSTAPGGAVLHAARAARAAGARVGAIVTAGPEPAAALGLRELEALPYLRVEPASRSIGFEHRSVGGDRQLRFDGSAAAVLSARAPVDPSAVLYAPVANELGTRVKRATYPRAAHAAILQGWLRGLRAGEAVEPLTLGHLSGELAGDLGQLDLLIASREDLAAESDLPEAQLDALRAAVGQRPAIVLTDSTHGVWLDLAASSEGARRWQLPAPRIVEGVSSVGAGDMFAALLLMGGWPPDPGADFLGRRATEAMRGVAAVLAQRG